MKILDDFRLNLGKTLFKPIFIGGMGVDISSEQLALAGAKMGCIGHISDAIVHIVTDKHYGTNYSKRKLEKYKYNIKNQDKTDIKFDLGELVEATKLYLKGREKEGSG